MIDKKLHRRAIIYGRVGLWSTVLAVLLGISSISDNRWDLTIINGILFVAASTLCIRSYDRAQSLEDE